MRRKFLTGCTFFVALLIGFGSGNSIAQHRSEYAGQEKRVIKSLSEDDIESLRNGRGWGLAKAAELNGMPGPIHVLEMKDEIGLSREQQEQIEQIYADMNAQAIPLGLKLIELESELDAAFANRTIDEDQLKRLLDQIADVQGQLRYVHLAAHLKTPDLLTPEQVDQYNQLRGYNSADPCANVPAGHDPEMWKKHNNCK